MAVAWDLPLPRLWVAALPGDPLDPDYLLALCDSQALPLGALFTAEDAAVPADLRSVFPHCEILPLLPAQTTPASYWETVSRYAAARDVAAFMVRTGTAVPPGGWRRLESAAAPGEIVFPVNIRSALGGAFSAVDESPGLDASQTDRWLNLYATGLRVDLPAPGGYAGFVVGGDTAQPRYILSDALFVDDRALPPEPLPDALLPAYRDAFSQRHPLTAMRHPLTELSRRAEPPHAAVPETRPVNLHISHGWGGGLARWIEDFTAADTAARSLVLKPIGDRSAYGQTFVLCDAEQPAVPLRTLTLATPIVSTAVAHAQYRDFVASILDEYAVSTLFVSSLIGHALDLLRFGLPTVVVVHDFFPVCPAVIATFGSPCEHCDRVRLEECLRENPRQQFFLAEDAAHWHRVRAAFDEAARAAHLQFVTPSLSVAERLGQLSDAHRGATLATVPHGLPAPVVRLLEPCRDLSPRGGDRPLVVVLGSAEPHKGSELLPELCARLEDCCDFLLLGYGDGLDGMPAMAHVARVPRYRRDELGALFSGHRPDLGLLLSAVPETFSYTLSELQAAAIPAVATRIGALAERIEHGVDGWLVDGDLAAVERTLRILAAERDAVAGARERLLEVPVRSAEAMVDDYYRLLSPRARFAAARPPLVEEMPVLEREASLLVDPEATYAEALRDFVAFTRRKYANSPRVPAALRRLLRTPRRQ